MRITYLKFILLMQTIFLKIDFYWWAKLLLIFKFKDSNARAHALLWGPRQSRSVQHTFTLSLTRGLDLQALVTEPIVFCEWLPPPVWEILEVFFFFQFSLPESRLMCLNCPGGCGCCLPVLNSAVTFEVVSWCVNEQGSL